VFQIYNVLFHVSELVHITESINHSIQSMCQCIHPLCQVVGIGHVNNVHSFKFTYVIF